MTQGNKNGADRAQENTDPAWKLLLRARKPEVSPFFVRNVLREIRMLEEKQAAGAWSRLVNYLFTVPRLAVAAAAAAIVVVAFAHVYNSGSGNSDFSNAQVTPVTPPLVATDNPVTGPVREGTAPSSQFDIGDYQEEVEMIDYIDGLLAVQDVEVISDEALAELLF